MKGPLEAARTRDYPYVVNRDERRLSRTNVIVANVPPGGRFDDCSFAVFAAGVLDSKGLLTPQGRRLVLDKCIAHARRSRLARCVVWALDDCTWIQPDGSHFDDTQPPVCTATMNPYLYEEMPLVAEHCWTVALPEGCNHSHLCIVPIDGRRIEITGGEPMLLGSFDDPVPEGERDPARRYVDGDGSFVAPRRFRGQPVTAVEGRTLYGPVQPVESGTILVEPFPHQVVDACERAAGRTLDDATRRRLWKLARPGLGFTPVGVLKAA